MEQQRWVGKQMSRNSCGFTMVELMIVLLLLGIVSAVAVPSLKNTWGEMKLDGAAREVVSILQYCQSNAIKKGESTIAQFNIGQDRCWCFQQSTGLKVLHPIDKKEYHIKFKDAGHFNGVDIIDVAFGAANKSSVMFSSLGEPDNSGSIIIGYGGFQRTITLSGVIGNIAVN